MRGKQKAGKLDETEKEPTKNKKLPTDIGKLRIQPNMKSPQLQTKALKEPRPCDHYYSLDHGDTALERI